jgi:hypothetical protein
LRSSDSLPQPVGSCPNRSTIAAPFSPFASIR